MEAELSEVEDHGEKTFRSNDQTRNLKVRNERIETGVWVKTPKGKIVSVDMKSGECYQWKAKGQCSKGDARSLRHDDSKRGKKTQSSSLAPRPQTQNDGRSPLKGISPGGSSLSGRKNQKACRHDLKGNCTNPLYDYWNSPVCQHHNSESGCEFS